MDKRRREDQRLCCLMNRGGILITSVISDHHISQFKIAENQGRIFYPDSRSGFLCETALCRRAEKIIDEALLR